MNCINLVLVLSFVAGIYCKPKVLTSETGDITSNDGTFFKIRAGKGKNIIIKIEKLKLGKGDFLKLYDGRDGSRWVYQMTRGTISRSTETGERRTDVTLPIFMETDARKLIIQLKGIDKRQGEQFSAHYASFSEEGSCRKDMLELLHGDAITTCNTDVISPVATSCVVTMECDRNYKQYSKTMECIDDRWVGEVRCQPKRNVVERCSFDFDQFTANSGCPFSNDEVARYYIDVLGVDVDQSLSRSGSRRVSCSTTCAFDDEGNMVQDCDGRITRGVYFLCLVCRVIYGCASNVVYF